MGIVIKTLKTAKSYYVYDRSTNCIMNINREQFNELQKVEKGVLDEEDSIVVQQFKKSNCFFDNSLQMIEHPYTCLIHHILNSHIEQITLQVTQRCNLRCKYCTYSGNINQYNRTHSNYDMDWETAKRAIDFYLGKSSEIETANVGFYGGEPLLKMELIKRCVDYIDHVAGDRKVTYSITTNGTLLTPKIAEYLFDHNFSIMISLDGAKEEHDKYRVFQDGTGSFAVIMNNLRSIKQNYPKKYNKILFNAVLNPTVNYKNVKDYFEKDDLMCESDAMLSLVDYHSSENIQFNDEFYRAREFEQFKLYLFMIHKLDLKDVSKLVLINYAQIKQRYKQLSMHRKMGCKSHHGGPCVPGGKRLFVNVFGELFPCERVSEKSEIMKIGNLINGFDYLKISELLNIGKLTEDECKSCWAINYCSLCCQSADDGNMLSKARKLSYCKNSKEQAYEELLEVCVLKELGCSFLEKGFDIYEKVGLSSEL